MYYTIQPEDVGKAFVWVNHKCWWLGDVMGRVLSLDVGKRVYRVGDILQVENNEQRDERMGGK